jgi:hypothetical protein
MKTKATEEKEERWKGEDATSQLSMYFELTLGGRNTKPCYQSLSSSSVTLSHARISMLPPLRRQLPKEVRIIDRTYLNNRTLEEQSDVILLIGK